MGKGRPLRERLGVRVPTPKAALASLVRQEPSATRPGLTWRVWEGWAAAPGPEPGLRAGARRRRRRSVHGDGGARAAKVHEPAAK